MLDELVDDLCGELTEERHLVALRSRSPWGGPKG